jgi:hypothetical protein
LIPAGKSLDDDFISLAWDKSKHG